MVITDGKLSKSHAGQRTRHINLCRCGHVAAGRVIAQFAISRLSPTIHQVISGQRASVSVACPNLFESFAGWHCHRHRGRLVRRGLAVAQTPSAGRAPAISFVVISNHAGVRATGRNLLDGFAGQHAAGVNCHWHEAIHGAANRAAAPQLSVVVAPPAIGQVVACYGAGIVAASGDLQDGFAAQRAGHVNRRRHKSVRRAAVTQASLRAVAPTISPPVAGRGARMRVARRHRGQVEIFDLHRKIVANNRHRRPARHVAIIRRDRVGGEGLRTTDTQRRASQIYSSSNYGQHT